jgi:voltage-gated potassium channel
MLERRDRWEAVTTVPLVVLGVLFIAAYVVSVLLVTPPRGWSVAIAAVLVVTWLAFAADYVVRLALTPAGSRGRFVRENIVDLLSVILPVFRAMRVVNLLRQIPYFHSRTPAAVRTEVICYALAYAVLFVFFIALATLQAERGAADATITDLGQALWWACVTIATVGYGDTYPVTGLGRALAVLLMVGGIAIVGTASALVISFINERVASRRNG